MGHLAFAAAVESIVTTLIQGRSCLKDSDLGPHSSNVKLISRLGSLFRLSAPAIRRLSTRTLASRSKC